MVITENLYDILGISKDVNIEEIKKAYKDIAKRVHPDKGGNTDDFLKVKLAYDILSDTVKRESYDKTGYIDPRLLSEESYALDIIKNIVIKLINDDNINDINLIESVRNIICVDITNNKKIIKTQEKKIKKFSKLAKTVKCKKKNNYIRNLIDSEKRPCLLHIEKLKNDIKYGELAYKLMKDYEFVQALLVNTIEGVSP